LGEADYHGEGTGNIGPGQVVDKIASVRDLLVALEQLRVAYNADLKLDDFVADNVSDKELAEKYGLEKGKPTTLRIEVKARPSGMRSGDTLGGDKKQEPETVVLLIGNKVPSEAKPERIPEPKVVPDGKDKPEGKADKKDEVKAKDEK